MQGDQVISFKDIHGVRLMRSKIIPLTIWAGSDLVCIFT